MKIKMHKTELSLLSKEELIQIIEKMTSGGISLSFNGKRTAEVIQRKVMPRQVRIDDDLSFGNNDNNLIIEGENLQAMVTLHKYKGLVDLIITDPPYNTGKDFRYNDKWDSDPNDPYLGELVASDDGSKHTKWLKFMLPRIKMMKAMLKPSGIIAICIDERELFNLGMLMNEVFKEENRIGIINWQKNYSPKSDSVHLSSATEYVLVYANEKANAETKLLDRTDQMNSNYSNPDDDPYDIWTGGDPTAATRADKDTYGIQSPFTGDIHYPGAGSWRFKKSDIQKYLKEWGSDYIQKDIGDGRPKALVIKDAAIPKIPDKQNLDNNPVVVLSDDMGKVLTIASKKAQEIQEKQVIPKFFFLKKGEGRPRYKRYLRDVKQGKVPLTYWSEDDYDFPFQLGSESWAHTESGHNQTGINELNYIIGKGHGFKTVKPLKLIEKIIQLWCPPNGVVLDPFAGSGTTGHAVLDLNNLSGANRSFILIEKGEGKDLYTRDLTRERIKRVITGERMDKKSGELKVIEQPVISGFDYYVLLEKVDAEAILRMKREELIDIIISSYIEERSMSRTYRINKLNADFEYLFGKSSLDEGFFIIWEAEDAVGELNFETYKKIMSEAKQHAIQKPYHVFARYKVYDSKNVQFHQIPDEILLHLGLNENNEKYHNDTGCEGI